MWVYSFLLDLEFETTEVPSLWVLLSFSFVFIFGKKGCSIFGQKLFEPSKQADFCIFTKFNVSRTKNKFARFLI